ncbi:MAG: MarR family winged helix-turn-helix transcriptional regulator [Pirellulales bacterium]
MTRNSPADRWLDFVQAALQAGRHVRQLLARVSSGWHLSDAELLLLWKCSQAAPAGHSEGELAGPLGLSASQLSAALYDLRDRGLLVFQRPPDGEERQPLTLTPLGAAALHDITQALAPATASWDTRVGEQELWECIELLRRLTVVSAGGDGTGSGWNASRSGDWRPVRTTRGVA